MKHLAWLALLLATACGRDGALVVCFGDSTTAWGGPQLNWTALVEEELSTAERPLRIVNAGRSSDDTELARGRFWWDVMRHRPDVVTLQFGINDASVDLDEGETGPRVALDRYVENLRYFAERVREVGGEPILLTPNPLRWQPWLRERYAGPPYRHDDPRGMNAVLDTYVAAVRGLAASRKIALVDLYRAYEASEGGGGPRVDDLLMDGIHPNDAGHRLVAREVGAVLAATLAGRRAAPTR